MHACIHQRIYGCGGCGHNGDIKNINVCLRAYAYAFICIYTYVHMHIHACIPVNVC